MKFHVLLQKMKRLSNIKKIKRVKILWNYKQIKRRKKIVEYRRNFFIMKYERIT